MKKLAFSYEMHLSFSAPVRDHRFQLRCIPASCPGQQVIDADLAIEPAAMTARSVDSFGSIVVSGTIAAPHTTFSYRATGIAFVDRQRARDTWENPLYRYDSPLTAPGRALCALASRLRASLPRTPPNEGRLAIAQRAMHAVHSALAYTPGSTTVRTTAEEALEGGAGVCQDYAHVLLALCRHLGVPARYIAGMLTGEGATHAWVEIFDGESWIGLDPTHDRAVDDSYITIAHGRDYRDCMVDIGIFTGARVTQRQRVNAAVHELET